MTDRDELIRQATQEVSRQLTDRGKLIEAGFAMFRAYVIAVDAPQVQIDEMKIAFMAGAQHLWGSINSVMDEDAEPTEADLRRMDRINDELTEFAKTMNPKGEA